jgi:hypothetical protein
MLLKVTSTYPIWGTPWVGYIEEGRRAYPLAGGDLDSLLAYALREGFDGIRVSAPSEEWATPADEVPVYF